MTPNDGFDAVVAELQAGFAASPDKPDETVASTAAALWYLAAGKPCAVGRAQPPWPALSAAQRDTLRALVRRRLAGEPLAYLTGVQEFLGHEFIAAPGALIPRRETELLGRASLAILDELAAATGATQPQRLLDLCTGCGNLAIALALRAPQAEVYASDLEAEALAVAARNVERHRLAGRVHLIQGDLFGALGQLPVPTAPAAAMRFALITCNPPYLATSHATNMPVEVAGSEPVAAFDGGPFGLSIVLRLIREAPAYLEPGGWLCFEIGAGQHAMVDRRAAQNEGFTEVRRTLDERGVVRAYQLKWSPA